MTTKNYEQMSKQELLEELQETQSQLSFSEYIYTYEDGYWMRFVVDLIMDGKIDAEYWAGRMPQVNPYPELIEAFAKRVQNTKHNLSEQEIADALNLLQQREEQARQSDEYEQAFLLRQQLRSKTETKH